MQYTVDFEPIGRRGECPADRSLLEAAHRLGVDLVSLCGGKGTCHRCRVQVINGEVSPPTKGEEEALSPQELDDGYRLACQTYPRSDCKLRVPSESLTAPQRTQVDGIEVAVSPDPPVFTDHPELLSHSRHNRHIGLALDIGTTKLAGYILDLDSGRTLTSRGVMNPQIAYGEDIIARLVYARKSPSDAKVLQKTVVDALNSMVADLCSEIGASSEEILEAVAVGNTAMHHLLLNLPIERLAVSPFEPSVQGAMDVKASDIGLRIAPGACVHTLPNIAGFVGADHVAMLLATGITRSPDTVLALDIGTNTEVSLARNGESLCVSCASGPAFEGAHIKDGMRAAPGAIERVEIDENTVEYQTIGGAAPAGICGSGILDALAQLYKIGVVSGRGRMGDHPRVREVNGKREFVLVSEDERCGQPAITVTQDDVRELQLAKGAIRTGIDVLLQSAGCTERELDAVVIAGAFGSYIDVASASMIGMLPPLTTDKFRQVGNAAGTGARLALISRDKRYEANEIASGVRYVELGTYPDFMKIFVDATRIGRG
jgi:uncharacterized 2Fe-2S/4Fe-4S cluster protein (DUF4445 family)